MGPLRQDASPARRRRRGSPMAVTVRSMADGEAPAVAAMVAALARDTGAGLVPKLTGEALADARDLIDVLVAETAGGELAGTCLSLMTFSTWRGSRGLYIVDLFVDGRARGQGTGLVLLREAARRGWRRGARFVKLEVDIDNEGAARFYGRQAFARKDNDRLFVLEAEALEQFISGEDRT